MVVSYGVKPQGVTEFTTEFECSVDIDKSSSTLLVVVTKASPSGRPTSSALVFLIKQGIIKDHDRLTAFNDI